MTVKKILSWAIITATAIPLVWFVIRLAWSEPFFALFCLGGCLAAVAGAFMFVWAIKTISEP